MTKTTKTEIRLNTIEAAIEDIKMGKLIIVVDDESRENEGDFIAAAEKASDGLKKDIRQHEQRSLQAMKSRGLKVWSANGAIQSSSITAS